MDRHANVYECFGPEVKLLFLVRQPSLATFSYYKMLMRRPRHYRYVRYYQGFRRYSVKLFTKFANEEIYTERKDRFQYDKWSMSICNTFDRNRSRLL